MRFILGTLALAGMITGVSAQGTKPTDTPPPDLGVQRAAPGDLGMAIMSARVSDTGVLLDGAGAMSVIRTDVGRYLITFGRNVRNCTPVVTSSFFVILTTSSYVFSDTEVIVNMYFTREQRYLDAPFSLIIYCHR